MQVFSDNCAYRLPSGSGSDEDRGDELQAAYIREESRQCSDPAPFLDGTAFDEVEISGDARGALGEQGERPDLR